MTLPWAPQAGPFPNGKETSREYPMSTMVADMEGKGLKNLGL